MDFDESQTKALASQKIDELQKVIGRGMRPEDKQTAGASEKG